MATRVLQSDTLLSSLLPSGGGNLASGDAIDFNGHTLVMDCDAVNYPFTPTNTGGVHCKLELRDLSRIKLNASLPSTVGPWVDPEHPLPVSAEPGIDGDPFRTPLTANARAEIQLNGTTFGLGGGSASLPTATRAGAFWAIVASSGSTTTLTFDRDFPLHAGDYIVNISAYTAIQKVQVTAYDASTRTATLASDPSRRTAGDIWTLLAGGVCINKVSTSQNTQAWFSSPVTGGTICLFSNYAANNNNGTVFNSAVVADRVLWGAAGGIGSGRNPILGRNNAVSAWLGQVACGILLHTSESYNLSSSFVGELASNQYSYTGDSRYFVPTRIAGGILFDQYSDTLCGTAAHEFFGVTFGIMPTVKEFASARLVNCTVAGTLIPADFRLLESGTISRTARTDFPTDTDLPDAQYHAPKIASEVTWRYETRWVRKGETLRMRARWMPGGAGSRAIVSVTVLTTLLPNLWKPGLDASLAKAEFPPGLEQLRWHDGSVEWRNDTGEDCQVRVWECVTGDTLGGYLRVWQATGGAM